MNREQLNKLAKPIVDIYNNIEIELLTNISYALKGNKEILATDPEAWMLLKLQNLGILDKVQLNVLKKVADLKSNEMNKVLIDAGVAALDQEAELKALKKGAWGIVPPKVSESPQILSILSAYQNQASNLLNLTNQSLLDSSKQVYIDCLNTAASKVAAGLQTNEQAVRSVITSWADKGIPTLKTKNGKTLGVEGYVRTVMVTTLNNLTNEMEDARYEEFDIELVEISSHEGNRPGCRPYAGRIFSLKPSHPKYPYLYDPAVGRIGDPDSLFGINCGHRKYAFVDGVSTQRYFPNNAKEDDKKYKESQKQREIERSIRKAKTRQQMLIANGDTEGAKAAGKLIKQRQKVMRDFIDETGRTRRSYREQIYTDKPKAPDESHAQLKQEIKKNLAKFNADQSKDVKPKETKLIKKQVVDKGTKALTWEEEMALKYPPKQAIDKVEDAAITKVKYKIGDEVQFNTANGAKLTGKINDIYGNEVTILDEDDFYHNIKLNDIIDEKEKQTAKTKAVNTNIPRVRRDIDINTFKRISEDFTDIKRDAETFRAIPNKDRGIVHKYTTSYYSRMNSYLRQHKNDNKDLQEEIDHLSEVIKTTAKPLSEDVVFFRKMDGDALDNIFGEKVAAALLDARINMDKEDIDKAKKLVIGGMLEDPAFISSTYVEGSYGSRKSVGIEIYAPKGYKGGIFVESVSEFSSEKEFLFDKDVNFDIIDVIFDHGDIKFKVTPSDM